ncbi:hypothetical protein LUZ61_020273 [Rhynchospora tenuis]|uniref:F-box domain-containing protein n=1 Tax=Rhynchospora tenuis TaxID=198213 RepID=A0AAD5ZD43_9POAL|nr:hypothetical protein LUZ61_020273 [Rhynchospora tenuis]
MGTMGGLNLLPEDCIAHVISFTSPRYACILSLVSSSFRSAADSDAIWERFLPSDYASLLSRAVEPVQYASKKELYMRLCDCPVQIDGGKLSFGLKKSTGAKCITIAVCEMDMPGYEDKKYWKLISLSNSRFPKAAKLTYHISNRHTQISGRIDSKVLSSQTIGLTECRKRVFLRPPRNPTEISKSTYVCVSGGKNYILDVKWSKKRIDGWMEVELGHFYNENWEDREVEIRLRVIRGYMPAGIVFLGIELRPKTSMDDAELISYDFMDQVDQGKTDRVP